jgi:hypothetical protein
VPEEDSITTIFTNRKDEVKLIEGSLSGAISGSSSHTVIVGSYGNGKTATLLHVKSQIDKHLSNQVLTVYMSNPGETLVQFYSNFVYSITLKKLEEIVWKYLAYITNNNRIKERIEKGNVLITEVLEKAKKLLQEEAHHTDFSNALLKIILEETKYLSWRYLCGESMAFEQRRQLDVVGNINTDEKVLRAIMTIKTILRKVGIKLICILIDELESIELLFLIKKQKILNGLRRLIDLNPTGLSFIMSCAPESWNSIIKDYHAFSERIFRQVELVPLSHDNVTEIVSSYLNKYRTISSKTSKQKNRSNNILYPFTKA